MANGKSEIRLAMPNLERKAPRSVEHSVQGVVVQLWRKAVTKQNNLQIPDPPTHFLPEWSTWFVISCLFSVSLDPLFLYIPVVNEGMKCLRLDEWLKATSFSLRSFTDVFYIADIMFRIFTRPKSESAVTKTEKAVPSKANRAFTVAKTIVQSCILLDILAILPIPQVVVFIFISKMKGSRSVQTWKFLNSFVLLQYVPRVLRIYLLCHERKKTAKKTGVWVKGFFNFFLYVLASHVIGALWYFMAIQRETACWQQACRSENGCELKPSTFNCDDPSFRNITLLSDLCPINPQNATLFDFGIFIDALQSGILQSTNFQDKFLNCFWWGLRNLSSLGQNLHTSTYAWENLFAVFISLIGLLLFVYLIGNLQTYMQLSTTTSEKLRRKMKMKGLEIELWLSEHGLPNRMKDGIMRNLHRKLEENKNVHLEILSVLPSEYLSYVKRCLCLATLRKVSKLKELKGEDELKGICEHFKPVIYAKDTFIIREKDPVDMILVITQGTVQSYTTSNGSSSRPKLLKKGDFYGEELITWTSKFPPSTDLPASDRIVKSLTRVEAFALTAEDLKNHVVLRYFWWQFTKDMKQFQHLNDSQMQQLKELAATTLQRAFRRRWKMKQHSSVPHIAKRNTI